MGQYTQHGGRERARGKGAEGRLGGGGGKGRGRQPGATRKKHRKVNGKGTELTKGTTFQQRTHHETQSQIHLASRVHLDAVACKNLNRPSKNK
jgi:hypothetical protein